MTEELGAWDDTVFTGMTEKSGNDKGKERTIYKINIP
jgi:hypothetical protein